MKALPRLIGVIHLPGLPGSPAARPGGGARDSIGQALKQALSEARLLEKAGFEGLILENFGDAPFYKDQVPPETVAAMARIAGEVSSVARIPLGINVLRNDARSALAVAAVVGGSFIRVNVLSGVAATDQGWIEGKAAELIRERDRLCPEVAILADVHVKHAKSFSSDRIELAVEETVLRARADAVIVTGETTGREVNRDRLQEASEACRKAKAPLYVGSGATAKTLNELMELAHGAIVGSFLRKGGVAGAALDESRVNELVRSFARIGKRRPGSG